MLSTGCIKNNRYRITDIIGRGGTSNVYLAWDMHLGKSWALKEICRNNDLAYVLAEREIEILRSIKYSMFPYIADAWQESDNLYIISEYVEGISMSELLMHKSIGRTTALSWLMQITKALEYLHELSPPIIFLDLKPDNILVRADGSLSIIDFGIAGRIASNTIPMGTPGYAAPEQYGSGSRTVDERTDIYALGRTYYSIRTGKVPVKETKKLIRMIMADRKFNYHERLILRRCIVDNPDKRLSSAKEVLKILNHINLNFSRKRRIINITALFVCIICMFFVGIKKYDAVRAQEMAATTMITQANSYISDGEYTIEGIKVITSFIEGNCLDEETEQAYTYEVAKNYMLVQHDYKKAYMYFERLNDDIFPEKEYLINICRLQMRFDEDNTDTIDNIARLYTDVCNLTPTSRKYENLLFIAGCYENFDPTPLEGIKKAVAVLEEGLRELYDLQEDSKSIWNTEQMVTKYQNRIKYLYMKAERVNK